MHHPRRDPARYRAIVPAALALLLSAAPLGAEEFRGDVELLYRNVSQDGSTNKYDEDFDGLESGARLSHLSANWLELDSGLLDFARLELTGLGGEPFESSSFRMGRKDRYSFSIRHTKQDYLYDLFELVPDEDGARWDAERTRTEVDLRIHATDRIDVFAGFHNGRRTGDSLFMKDISREVFRLETPLDYEVKNYTVGARFEIGVVDVEVSHRLRRYANEFDNTTEGDEGLSPGGASLTRYDWRQSDRGGTDVTTVRLGATPHERIGISASIAGTFLGEEEMTSDVFVESLGINFQGDEFGGRCSISGVPCRSDATCGSGGGQCVAIPGFSAADLEGDTLLADVDLSVVLASPLDLHLSYRRYERDLAGTLFRDLEGSGPPDPVGEPDGIEDDLDGDGTPGSSIVNNYELDSWTALLEYRPVRQVTLRGGYRVMQRELERDGFGDGFRDSDFESDGDETVVGGIVVRPVRWLRLNADYEDGEIDQPFNAVAPLETEHVRVRAVFTPQDDMRVDVGLLRYDQKNDGLDFRVFDDPANTEVCNAVDDDADGAIDEGCWNGRQDVDTWSVSFWHRANERIDYLLRWAEQQVESDVRITFDEAGFGAVSNGNSIFDVDNTQWTARINFGWGRAWKGFFQFWWTESDGDNVVLNDNPGFTNSQKIDQVYRDAEVGLEYSFTSGLRLGASFRDFDYDDDNDLIDYSGEIVAVRAGLSF